MTRLDPETFLGLWANLPKVQALREIEARRARGDVNSDRVYALYLAATGSKDQAADALLSYQESVLKSGQKVE